MGPTEPMRTRTYPEHAALESGLKCAGRRTIRPALDGGGGLCIIGGMTRHDELPLAHTRPGTRRVLPLYRFGRPGARPKTYIQAGLHADETPGLLVARHLIDRLAELDAAGAVRGEIAVVPVANPIGMDQPLLGGRIGRFELATGVNFNRDYPDLAPAVAERVRDRLGADVSGNVDMVRAALAEALAALPTRTEGDSLRKTLLSLAMDADVVLDLHCDSEALMHLYTMPALWDGFADLAARLGCAAAFLADVSGGEPFDEACSGFWPRLRALVPAEVPLPDACAATTIELRGYEAIDDAQGAADAAAILDHLRVRGVLAGDPPPAPPACAPTPLAGLDRVTAPVAGVVLFTVELGETVTAGQTVALVLDPFTGARHPCTATTAGLVWSRQHRRYVNPDEMVVVIAGAEPLAGKGAKLLTA